MAGLLDSPAGDQLLDAVRDSYAKRVEIERQSLADDLAVLDQEAARLGEERRARQDEATKLREAIDRDSATAEKLLGERDDWHRRSRQHQVDLAAKRSTYPLRLLERQIESRVKVREGIDAHLLHVERHRLEVEKAAFEVAKQRRELNAPEYDRRVKALEDQQAEAAKRRAAVEAWLTALRGLGITRTTGGFLSWAGYVSFAGLGWMVGEYVHDLIGDPEGMVSGLFVLLVNGFESLVQKVGGAIALVLLMALPFIVGAVAFTVLSGSDRLLRRFDDRWKRKAAKREGKRRDTGPWTLITGSGEEIDRKYYLQWLAKVPIYALVIFLVSVVAVLFNLGRRGLDQAAFALQAEAPFQAGLYTFAGVALCVLVTGVTILYLTRVVEIRAAAVTDGERIPPSFGREFKILGIALLALTVIGIVLSAAPALKAPLGSVFEGMCLLVGVVTTGFVAAFGMIHKGLTRELDALRREVEQYETEIQKFAAWPVMPASTEEIDEYRQDLANLYEGIAKLWREADYWELPAERLLSLTGLSVSGEHELRRAAEGASVKRWLSGLLRKSPARNRLYVDELLEPDLVSQILSAVLETNARSAEIERLRERRGHAEARLAELEALDRAADPGQIEKQRAQRRHQALQRLNALRIEEAEEVARYEAALRAGKMLRGGVGMPLASAA